MKSLIIALAVWIAAQTGYEIPKEIPTIKTVKQEYLINVFYHNMPEVLDCYAKKCDDYFIPFIEGLYDRFDNIIYLNEGFDPENDYHKAILLHELVHWFQYSTSTKHYACVGEREKEAYFLQFLQMKS